jgi:hypothetical protein
MLGSNVRRPGGGLAKPGTNGLGQRSAHWSNRHELQPNHTNRKARQPYSSPDVYGREQPSVQDSRVAAMRVTRTAFMSTT